jgi:hypothetical protein
VLGLYCATHKQPGMVDVRNKRCAQPGCTKLSPSFNADGEALGLYCVTHKQPGMVDVRNKRCAQPGCTKLSPSFNADGEALGLYCVTHKQPGMVDVRNKRCAQLGCTVHAWYGRPGCMSTHCATHRAPGEIRYPRARCERCREPALYGVHLELRRCETHREPGDQNLAERPCVSCGLAYVLSDSGHCEACRPGEFERVVLAKQRALMAFLDARGLAGTQTDRMLDGGVCGRERPDRVFELGEHIVIVECDEDQHRGRACVCEQTRMVNLAQAYGGTPVAFVRFNPDEYTPARGAPLQLKMRYVVLVELLESWGASASTRTPSVRLPAQLCSVMYLFFDGDAAATRANWHTLSAVDVEAVMTNIAALHIE